MKDSLVPTDRRIRKAVRRLLDAVDHSLETSREVEKARAALERESNRGLRLCGAENDRDGGDPRFSGAGR